MTKQDASGRMRRDARLSVNIDEVGDQTEGAALGKRAPKEMPPTEHGPIQARNYTRLSQINNLLKSAPHSSRRLF